MDFNAPPAGWEGGEKGWASHSWGMVDSNMASGAIPSRIARELLGFSKDALERWAARGEPAVACSMRRMRRRDRGLVEGDQPMRVGVVDIGTNSTRMLIGDVQDGRVDEVERRTTVTNLGRG